MFTLSRASKVANGLESSSKATTSIKETSRFLLIRVAEDLLIQTWNSTFYLRGNIRFQYFRTNNTLL